MTFTYTPPNHASVNDRLFYEVYDANAIDITKTDYKYVGELWVDGVKVQTERAYPRPGSAVGIFDFSGIIRSHVVPEFAPTTAIDSFQLGEGKARTADIVVKIREEYNGTVGAVVLTDSARQFYNHYNERPDGLTAIAGKANAPATSRPLTISLPLAANYYFVPVYRTSTTGLSCTLAGNAKTITPAEANSLLMVNIAPGAINAEFAGSITAATDSYDCVIAGVTYTVKVACPGWYTNYVVHLMSKYSGFESMLFNKPRRITQTIERKGYKKPAWRSGPTGGITFGTGAVLHEQAINYVNRFTEKLRIQTELISDAEYVWLAQLVNSTTVYLEEGGNFYPVKLTASDYQFNEYLVDRLTSLQVDLEFGSSRNTQYK